MKSQTQFSGENQKKKIIMSAERFTQHAKD